MKVTCEHCKTDNTKGLKYGNRCKKCHKVIKKGIPQQSQLKLN